jgi:NADH-quinone oxidoreductase subunit A
MADLVYFLLIFLGVGVFFLFIHLVMGKFLRPGRPDPEKLTIYECGEPTVGSAWIQFDLRYYVVALLFVIFDVEVAFFFPWAVVFGSANALVRNPDNQEVIAQMETGLPRLPQEVPAKMTSETAKSWAWVAFLDILIFFGVLMVGFAYLWRRGDIDWVRSTVSERAPTPGLEELHTVRTVEMVAGPFGSTVSQETISVK